MTIVSLLWLHTTAFAVVTRQLGGRPQPELPMLLIMFGVSHALLLD
jgi:hypothetical protein